MANTVPLTPCCGVRNVLDDMLIDVSMFPSEWREHGELVMCGACVRHMVYTKGVLWEDVVRALGRVDQVERAQQRDEMDASMGMVALDGRSKREIVNERRRNPVVPVIPDPPNPETP